MKYIIAPIMICLVVLASCGMPDQPVTGQAGPTPTLPNLPGHPGTDPNNPWPYGTPNIAERTQIAVGTVEAQREAAAIATAAAIPTIALNQQPTLTYVPTPVYAPLRGVVNDIETCNGGFVDFRHPIAVVATGCWFGTEGGREVVIFVGGSTGSFNYGQLPLAVWKITASAGLQQDDIPYLGDWKPGTYSNDYGSATLGELYWAPVTDDIINITQVNGNLVTIVAQDNPSRIYVFDFSNNIWTSHPNSAPTLPGTPSAPTITPTPPPAAFPATTIRDNFNRANGAVGSNWTGATSVFTIQSNTLATTMSAGSTNRMVWTTSFGSNQEAYAKLPTLPSASVEINLVLKEADRGNGRNLLLVSYQHQSGVVQVWTTHNWGTWIQHGTNLPATFQANDQFGARASADGTVRIYKNGVLLGSRTVASTWPHCAEGGRIGVWLIDAGGVKYDDFGGGTLP